MQLVISPVPDYYIILPAAFLDPVVPPDFVLRLVPGAELAILSRKVHTLMSLPFVARPSFAMRSKDSWESIPNMVE